MFFQGGFGTAYQCTCLASGKEKAVKVVARSAIHGAKEMQKVRAQHHVHGAGSSTSLPPSVAAQASSHACSLV